jgi:hypothetical protein
MEQWTSMETSRMGRTGCKINLPGEFEPSTDNYDQMVAGILVGSMILTRRKGYPLFDRRRTQYGILSDEPDSARCSGDLVPGDYMLAYDSADDVSIDSTSTAKHPPKARRCCGTTMYTPNTSQFAGHLHSRIMQKFPFLMEMFYWIITYGFYRCTALLSQAIFSETGIWDVAQDHGLAILEFEQFSRLSFLWPISEQEVQQWFMHGHQTFLTVLNRSYALIHIPGTVGYVHLLMPSELLTKFSDLSLGITTSLLPTTPSPPSAEQ